MKELKNKKVVTITVVCVLIVACIAGIATVSYNHYQNNNKRTVQTFAQKQKDDNEYEEIADSSESLDSDESLEASLEEAKELDLEEVIEISEEEKKKQEEEEKRIEEEEQKKKKEEEEKNKKTNYPYYIKVNYTANTVTIYQKDEKRNYTVPIKAMICSTGAATPTSGVYQTQNKRRWGLLIGNSYGQYTARITGQILFHSVPCEKQSPDSLITRYYDRLGTTTSLGCIRLTVADAKWIYDNCPVGTSVEFYSSSNPGPLGKPTAQKIGDAGEPLNRWDPTDPDPNNPWRNQTVNQQTQENVNEEKQNEKVEEEKTEDKKEVTENNKNETTNNNQSTETNNQDNNKNNNENDNQKETNNQNNITVRNVVGQTESIARSNLVNLSVTVEYKSDDTKKDGIVLSQSIQPGSIVSKQTKIVIYVNKIESKDNSKVDDNKTNPNQGNKNNSDDKSQEKQEDLENTEKQENTNKTSKN